jgi:hypothetical protein
VQNIFLGDFESCNNNSDNEGKAANKEVEQIIIDDLNSEDEQRNNK